jgi:hypothetical protein
MFLSRLFEGDVRGMHDWRLHRLPIFADLFEFTLVMEILDWNNGTPFILGDTDEYNC